MTVDVTDANGASDLRYVHLMLSPVGSSTSDPRSGLWMHLDVAARRLYGWNGTGWGAGAAFTGNSSGSGWGSNGTMTSSGTLTVAQGTINAGASSIVTIPNGYRISIAFTPNPSFTGTFELRALVQDSQPVNGWDLNSLRAGSIVTIGASQPSSSTAAKTGPSGGSS